MFDAKNEAHEFVAESRDEAIQKASQFFDAEPSELTVCEFPAGAVFGLGGRTVIVAARAESRGAGREHAAREPRARDRGGRAERGARDGERRDDRGRRGRSRGSREERGGREARPARDAEERPRNTEPSVGSAEGPLGETGEFVRGIVERMNLGPFTIKETEESDLVIFDIRGAAAQALSDGEGRAVDAIQLLANQEVMRSGGEAPRVVIDIEGESAAREEFLGGLAERVARRARQTGRAVALDPMNAKDRRLIHVALREAEGIATMSIGEGRYRQVVVVPEGAPEFEEASRASSSH